MDGGAAARALRRRAADRVRWHPVQPVPRHLVGRRRRQRARRRTLRDGTPHRPDLLRRHGLRVDGGAYPDPKAGGARMVVVELEAVRALGRPVTLREMRGNAKLAGFDLLRLPRLSVMPVSAAYWTEILRVAKE